MYGTYEQAIRLNPSCADAYYIKSVNLNGLSRFEEVLAAHEQVIRLIPKARWKTFEREA